MPVHSNEGSYLNGTRPNTAYVPAGKFNNGWEKVETFMALILDF